MHITSTFRHRDVYASNVLSNFLLFALSICVISYFLYLILFSGAAWLHPEITSSSYYVWIGRGQESFGAMLHKFFDWQAFDGVNRVRTLNDLFEIVDGIARPYITLAVGVQPSLNVSTVLTAVFAPTLFYGWARRAIGSRSLAIMLALVFISTTGFLSDTVAYLHPAKKLNLLFLCAALYFSECDREGDRYGNYAAMCINLLCSFFSDEAGLGNFVVVAVLYWRQVWRSKVRISVFILLPCIYLATARWGLPAMYAHFSSIPAPWDAFGGAGKVSFFGYFFVPEFQGDAIIQLARSFLSTFSIYTHTVWTEIVAVFVILGYPAFRFLKGGLHDWKSLGNNRFVLATISLVLLNGYVTLLDWFPFPHEISYLGSFNYYYHSGITVLVLVWAAFAIENFSRQYRFILIVMTTLLIVSNFSMYKMINVLVQNIHYSPRSVADVNTAIETGHLASTKPDREREDKIFYLYLHRVFGKRMYDNGFYATHVQLNGQVLIQPSSVQYLRQIFYPWSSPMIMD